MTRLFRRRRFWLGATLLIALALHRLNSLRFRSADIEPAVDSATVALARKPLLSTRPPTPTVATVGTTVTPRWVAVQAVAEDEEPLYRESHFPDRLRNTGDKFGRLSTNNRAILLRNALVDTSQGEPLRIPVRLHMSEPTGTYIVQAQNGVDASFYARIKAEGGRVISYIPNNALIIQAESDVAARLASAPEVSAVLPNQPYFKLEPGLLARILRNAPLPPNVRVAVSVVDERGLTDIRNLGEEIEVVQRGPFGPIAFVREPKDLIALARLPSVPLLEEATPRVLLNDRTGLTLQSSTNANNTGPNHGLTGAGLLVNLNDSGLDSSHPDLGPAGRVLSTDARLLTDREGHGSHVAGIIAGNGKQSALVTKAPQGSVTNANFRGKAPNAKLLILPIDLRTGPTISDAFLQETFARTNRALTGITNAPISNNSWGYRGRYEYTSFSASYDAASRDALPEDSGEQPILFVFAAGNDGDGASNGAGGSEDTVSAPGNAKNVITVGALESLRQLTNAILYDTNGTAVWAGSSPMPNGIYNSTNTYETNLPFLAATDTDFEVASFSSRGNVGVGSEGDFGRFKPDVVAPGSFIFSVRSKQWSLRDEFSFFPDPTTNEFFRATDDLNKEGADWYRYESGTSMAAPAISGLLAQLEEYFEIPSGARTPQHIPVAGYKAILINSAHPTSDSYKYDLHSTVNYSGWGLPTLNAGLGGGFSSDGQPIVGFSVRGSGSAGLATGQGKSYRINVNAAEIGRPISFTLAWTDPPGNPSATIKLVNNLDLIVSNTLTGEFYVGNDFSTDTRFSQAHSATDTNLPLAAFDFVNNVERIIIPGRATNADLVLTVLARRVNVNAVAGDPDQIIQDSALILGVEGSTSNDSLGTVTTDTGAGVDGFFTQPPVVIGVTNGELRLNERVGANSPLLGTAAGQAAQWRFYVFTNSLVTNTSVGVTSGPNVAFVTFLPPNLAAPRNVEADIDLYVSRNSGLTNLNPAVLSAAFKSTQRGGTELVVFSNAVVGPNEVYYIGVKSEDQQGGEYSFIALSSQAPFGTLNSKGELVFPGFALRQPIPDGTPDRPGFGLSMALAIFGGEIRRISVDETISHGAYLDLVNTLQHNHGSAVLQNNRLLRARDGFFYNSGLNRLASYDDSGSGDDPGAFATHGPGSLNDYAGRTLQGVWLQQAIDNRLGNSGQINAFTIRALTNDFGNRFVSRTVQPGRYELEVINVPADASRLRVVVTNMIPALPLRVLIKREEVPDPADPNSADKFADILPPGGTLALGIRDVPPLVAGRYFILVFNPNGVAVKYRIAGFLDRDLGNGFDGSFSSIGDANGPLADQALTQSDIFVNDSRPVTSVEVGLRISDQRESDLFVHLVSPSGQRVLVTEARGRLDTNGYGSDNLTVNFSHIALTFDRSSGAARLYVNGRPVAQDVFPGFDPATLGDFIFGRDLSGRLSPTDSPVRLDDFALWRRALSPDDLIEVFNRGFAGSPKIAEGAEAALYRFDGNGLDASGHGADALLGTTPKFVLGQFDQAVELGGTNGFALADNQPFKLVITNFITTNIIAGLPMLVTNSFTNIVRRTPPLDVGTNGFTLEGWVAAPSGDTNIVIAGWSDRTNYYAPALLVGFDEPLGKGPGSFSAALVDTNGSVRFLASQPGLITTNPFIKTYNYATFSEKTNESETLIKFVDPPFTGTAAGTIVAVTSSFETAAAGNYRLNESVEDWLVTTNAVAVVADPSAFDGVQLLALGRGTIVRQLGTAPGQLYQVYFRTRKHPGETSLQPVKLLVGGVPDRDLVPTIGWTTQVTSFLARSNSMSFTFQSQTVNADTNLVAFGMDLDAIELKQLNSEVRYLPEEALLPLAGGNAFGQWQLEVTDSRGQIVGDLLSWHLQLTFAPTNPPVVRLTNSVAYHGTNRGGPSYFFIDVPVEATVAVNQLTALTGRLGLFYSSSGLPDGGLQPDDVNLLPSVLSPTTGAAVVTTTLPPILPRGQRYYLEVVSRPGTATNEFTIQVDFNVPFTPLTNNLAVLRTNLPGGSEDYYYFDVSPQAISVSFEVLSPSSDVDLFLSTAPNLPRPALSQYASKNPGLADEKIVLDAGSQPAPLRPGRWNLGVFNPGTNAATYTVVVHENRTSLVALTNDRPVQVANSISGKIDYYYIDVAADVISGRFEVRGLTGDADLYVRRESPLPTATSFDYASTNSGQTNELILVTANDVPIPMQPGRWLLGVNVKGAPAVSYEVLASIQYPTAGLVDLFDDVPETLTGAAPGRTDYRFPVFDPTGGLQFELFDLDGAADLFVSRGTLPRVAIRQFSSLNPGTAAEFIFVSTNDVANFVADWYLTVERPVGGASHWTVKARTLTNGIPDLRDTITGRLIPPTTPGDPFQFQWNVVALGQRYQVQCALNLSAIPVPWTDFGAPILGDQASLSVTLPVFTDVQRYYRVRISTNVP